MTLLRVSSAEWAGSHLSIDVMTDAWMAWQTQPASFTWTTQYRAIYIPIRIPQRAIVKEMGWGTGSSASGNIDIGLYSCGGTRLVSSGSTAVGSANSSHTAAVTNTTVGPGMYYAALNSDSTTATFVANTAAAPFATAMGVLTETLASVVLPATASWAVNQALSGYPVISVLLVTELS